MKNNNITSLVGIIFLLPNSFNTVFAADGPLPNPFPKSCVSLINGSNTSSIIMANQNGKYECAFDTLKSDNKIGAYGSESQTFNAAIGYTKRLGCSGQSGKSGDVKISSSNPSGNNLSTDTWTAKNNEDGDRHWGAATLWQTTEHGGVRNDQINDGCRGSNAAIWGNYLYPSRISMTASTVNVPISSTATFTIKVESPYGNENVTGNVYLQVATGSPANPLTDRYLASGPLSNGVATLTTNLGSQDTSGTKYPPNQINNVYATFPGSFTNGAPPTQPTIEFNGWTPSQTESITVSYGGKSSTTQSLTPSSQEDSSSINYEELRKTLSENQNARQKLFADNADPISEVINSNLDLHKIQYIYCNKGNSPVQASLYTSGESDMYRYMTIKRKGSLVGARIRVPSSLYNEKASIQLVCRNDGSKIAVGSYGIYGTTNSDMITSNQDGKSIFSGLGSDIVSVTHSDVSVFSGPGNDVVRLYSAGDSANGGLGDDNIMDDGNGSNLIIGGPGKDKLIGGYGETKINAMDGSRGDVVICRSNLNKVISDAGDTLKGPCTRISKGPSL